MRRSKKIKRCLTKVLLYPGIVFALFLANFPIVWTVMTSFKTDLDAFASPPVVIFKPTLVHWHEVLIERGFMNLILNSLVISTGAVALALLVGTPAAYSFARFKTKARNNLLSWIISWRIFPPVVVVIPLFVMFKSLDLVDTHISMILVYALFNIPFVVLMMKGFFEEIPTELEESALVDGCSRLGVFRRISLHIAKPGLTATAIFTFIQSWNEFLVAYLLTRGYAATVTIGAVGFVTDRAVYWGEICTAATAIMIPMLILGIILRKYLVMGITLGAVRG